MALYLDTYSAVVKPDPNILIPDWADDKFQLAEYSAEKGKYRISRTPFVREILYELSPQTPTQEVVVMKPTQLAGTTVSLILISFGIDTGIGDMLMMMPTEDMAKRFSKKRLAKTIELIPDIKSKIGESKSRDSSNTILDKTYAGGSITLKGSNSGASYRSDTYRVVIGDDVDGFESDIGGEGDPGELLDARTGSIKNSKIYKNSTPTLRETSLIYREYQSSSQGKFNVPCPRCDKLQYLRWGGPDADFGIKFRRDDDGDITDVWYECKHCHGRIEEHQKTWMMDRGKYVHKYPNRKKRGFHYNAIYTPIGWKNTWTRLVEKFLIAAAEIKTGQPQKMTTFTNTMMAEPSDAQVESLDWEILSQRRDRYPEKLIPAGGLFLTAGIDTQDNRLALVVRAWGRGEENWKIYYTELWGDPNSPEVWTALDQIIDAQYEAENSQPLRIVSACVDSQGHRTQAVYNYCRTRFPKTIAIQGVGGDNKPILGVAPSLVDVDFGGEKIKDGCHLWSIGSYQAKVTIYARLKMAGMGAGVYHWPETTTDEYFKQLTAEKLKLKYVKGFAHYEWTKEPGKENHALDCEVYAYAAAIRVGMGRPGFWEELEKMMARTPVKPKPEGETENKDGWIGKKKGGWLK